MFSRVLALIVKELLALLKDPKSRMVLIGPPLMQLIVFGYAATFDLNQVPFVVYNADTSAASRDLIAHFTGTPTFRLVARVDSLAQIPALIEGRKAVMALAIDARFTRDLLTGQPAPVEVIVDGRNSNTALIALGYANEILSDYAASWASQHGARTPSALVMRARYNPNLESRWFIIPGIIALLAQVVTLLVVALTVAREREAGTFDQLLVTPLRPVDILLGKGIPGLIIGLAEATVILLAAVFWFGVPLRGAVGVFYLGAVVFIIAVIGIGLLISALSATQQQALLGAFLFMVPSIILSGFATPIANMPQAVQWLTLINPLRYFLVVVRSVFLQAASLASLSTEIAAMAAIGCVSLVAATVMFRRRVY